MGNIPSAYKDAAAACVLIGTKQTKSVLIEALGNSNLEIQHAVVCALEHFEDADTADIVRQWKAKNDGITDPLGEDLNIAGRTITTYSFTEISHANMKAFFNGAMKGLETDFGLAVTRWTKKS